MRRRPAAVPEGPAPDPDEATGPREAGNARAGRARRQYCWWITLAYPYPETVARLSLRTPDDFSRQEFCVLVRECHVEARVTLTEAAVFLEYHGPHRLRQTGERLPHLNCLTRSDDQYARLAVGRALMSRGVRVDFGKNISNWHEGVMYGCVMS